ncbi:MAG: type II toxin-antitoxin system RelE/ParE family toxin [Candidatus Omnitrophota bacterium]
MPRYKLLKASEADLEDIWKYTYESWGGRQASKYLRQLKKRIEALSRNPDIGWQRDNLSKGLMCFREGRHLIFYRKLKMGIVIIRVLHDRMDVPERIKETEE